MFYITYKQPDVQNLGFSWGFNSDPGITVTKSRSMQENRRPVSPVLIAYLGTEATSAGDASWLFSDCRYSIGAVGGLSRWRTVAWVRTCRVLATGVY